MYQSGFTREADIFKIYKYVANDKISLQWSATESDEGACRGVCSWRLRSPAQRLELTAVSCAGAYQEADGSVMGH